MCISQVLKAILDATKTGFLKWRADDAGFCETFLTHGERVILEPGLRYFHYHDEKPDLTLYIDNGTTIPPPIHTYEDLKSELCWVGKLCALLKYWLCLFFRAILFIRVDPRFKLTRKERKYKKEVDRLIREERKEIDRLLREIAAEVVKVAEVTVGRDKRIGMYRIDDQLLHRVSTLFFAAERNCRPKPPDENFWKRLDGVMYRPWEHPRYEFRFDPSILDTSVVITGLEMSESYLIPGIYDRKTQMLNSCDSDHLFKDETLLRLGEVADISKYLLETTLGVDDDKDIPVSNDPDVIDLSGDSSDDFHSEEYPNAADC